MEREEMWGSWVKEIGLVEDVFEFRRTTVLKHFDCA